MTRFLGSTVISLHVLTLKRMVNAMQKLRLYH